MKTDLRTAAPGLAPTQAAALQPLSERAFLVDSLLLRSECAELMALAESRGFATAGVRTAEGPKPMPLVRNNERVVVTAPQWVATLWSRLCQVPLPPLENEAPVGLPRDLRFYKYTPGQRFKMHKDGPWQEDGRESRLTLLVYLNEGFAGGETRFRDFSVTPHIGSALLFMHDTWHEGAEVKNGIKYVLRSDVMYGPKGCSEVPGLDALAGS